MALRAGGAAAAPGSGLAPGRKVLVRYDEELWHCRLLLARASGGRWVIYTPDADLYVEDYGQQNDDITGLRLVARDGVLPDGLGPIYTWRAGEEPAGCALQDLFREAQELAHLEGAGPPGRVADSVWVYTKDIGNVKMGDVCEDRDGAFMDDHGLVRVDGEVTVVQRVARASLDEWKAQHSADTGLDARILPIAYTVGNERFRDWSSVAERVEETSLPGWPVAGPRTAGWVVRFMAKRRAAPQDYHRWWRTTARLAASDTGVQEHATCCRILSLAGTFDQVDIPNLACLEVVARRLETIEYSYKDRTRDGERGVPAGTAASSLGGFNMLSYDEADLFDGSGHVGSTVCCAPSLVEHVSKELEKEAQIQKQARKAREERALTRNPPNPAGHTDGPPAGGGKKK